MPIDARAFVPFVDAHGTPARARIKDSQSTSLGQLLAGFGIGAAREVAVQTTHKIKVFFDAVQVSDGDIVTCDGATYKVVKGGVAKRPFGLELSVAFCPPVVEA